MWAASCTVVSMPAYPNQVSSPWKPGGTPGRRSGRSWSLRWLRLMLTLQECCWSEENWKGPGECALLTGFKSIWVVLSGFFNHTIPYSIGSADIFSIFAIGPEVFIHRSDRWRHCHFEFFFIIIIIFETYKYDICKDYSCLGSVSLSSSLLHCDCSTDLCVCKGHWFKFQKTLLSVT